MLCTDTLHGILKSVCRTGTPCRRNKETIFWWVWAWSQIWRWTSRGWKPEWHIQYRISRGCMFRWAYGKNEAWICFSKFKTKKPKANFFFFFPAASDSWSQNQKIRSSHNEKSALCNIMMVSSVTSLSLCISTAFVPQFLFFSLCLLSKNESCYRPS